LEVKFVIRTEISSNSKHLCSIGRYRNSPVREVNDGRAQRSNLYLLCATSCASLHDPRTPKGGAAGFIHAPTVPAKSRWSNFTRLASVPPPVNYS
jgi:hypothetical protein